MKIIEPHIHMYSRTTDDYQAMYAAGIRACVEPSFWLGTDRRHAGTFFDYFQLILEFETERARRFGIDHFAAVALNPKETEDRALADAVIDGLDAYLDHERCVALGEIGFNLITDNEEHALRRQLAIAEARELPVIVHLPHTNKPAGAERLAAIMTDYAIPCERIVLDHNTEETIEICLATGCYCGMTVYPISKLTPARVSEMVRQYGSERMIVNGSADWGVSDPLSLVKVAQYMQTDGHSEETIQRLVHDNATAFYSATPRWRPNLDLEPIPPETFQR